MSNSDARHMVQDRYRQAACRVRSGTVDAAGGPGGRPHGQEAGRAS
jgi:hypothetical protein